MSTFGDVETCLNWVTAFVGLPRIETIIHSHVDYGS